jgi:hypothetical protein
VEDRWNDQAKADAMVQEAVVELTGEASPKKAWRALFRHFNKIHGRGARGYKKGEMIAVKLNLNNAITHHDTIELNSSPFCDTGTGALDGSRWRHPRAGHRGLRTQPCHHRLYLQQDTP